MSELPDTACDPELASIYTYISCGSILFSCIAVLASIVFLLVIEMLIWLLRNKNKIIQPIDENISVLNQIVAVDRQELQVRIACASNSEDLYSILDDFPILKDLNLPTECKLRSINTENIDQTFRDLIRERVTLNEIPLRLDNTTGIQQFKDKFLNAIENSIATHVTDIKKRKQLAMHICLHLSRTRSGGDSLFAVQNIFASQQVIMTTS
jgi:hypothetical protein